MTTGQIIFILIGTLCGITVIMMFMILMISGIELRNSRRHLNFKMLLHYETKFSEMVDAFYEYEITDEQMTYGDYKNKREKIDLCITAIQHHLMVNCADQNYHFTKSHVSEQLFGCAQRMIEIFQEWVDNISKINNLDTENSEEFECLWEEYLLKYNLMRLNALDMKQLISNEATVEVVK